MRIVKERINIQTEEYVSESQAAAMLQLAVGTLRNLRYADKGFIPHVRDERRKVFYKREDVIAYRDKPKARLEHEYPRIPVLFNDNPLPDLDQLVKLTTAEAALAYSISKASLQIWRSKRQFLGVLPFHGGHSDIHYLAAELSAFITEGRRYWKARSIELGIQFQPHPRSGRAA
ncbi:helix-turn-helix domain-containing protein [Pseudomonas aeruginosa]|nr:helix-turn-helix domain-containing protein [Pseudomonas aeruginosa]